MFNKIMLFISSYIPLYVLLIFKNIFERITVGGKFIDISHKLKNAKFFDEINDYSIIILGVLTVISFFYLKAKVKNTETEHPYEIKCFTDETGNYYFSYISIYLLSCLGLSLNNIVDNFVFLFLMIIVGYIYISNNMVYMNPTINFIGYKVFDATLDSLNTNDKDMKSIIIIDKNLEIKKGDTILASAKSGFVFANKILEKED